MLGQNTYILMSNLHYKSIQDIIIGDLVRLANNSYAKVIFIYSGINYIYNIITDKFGNYQVTNNHKLALILNNQYNIKTINDFMKNNQYNNKQYNIYQGYILSGDYPITYNFIIKLYKIDIYYGFNLNTTDNRIIINKNIITYSK